jgi:hypothetical protein
MSVKQAEWRADQVLQLIEMHQGTQNLREALINFFSRWSWDDDHDFNEWENRRKELSRTHKKSKTEK